MHISSEGNKQSLLSFVPMWAFLTHTHTHEIDLFGVIKTLWLSPNLHIEFDLPLRAALIFPLSHMVQCAASDTQ